MSDSDMGKNEPRARGESSGWSPFSQRGKTAGLAPLLGKEEGRGCCNSPAGTAKHEF
jgi:hypothetical protein